MSLPANANLGFIKGYLVDGAGNPVAGTVTFTPSVTKLLDASATPNPVTVLPRPITVTLGGAGEIPTTAESTAATKVGQHLLSTADTDLQPVGWTWQASFALTGSDLRIAPFSFALGVGEQIDLTTVSPLSSAGGAVIVQGIPTGGATGQVLRKKTSTDYDTEWADPTGGGGGGATTLDGLTDVTTAGVTTGQVLKYNGTEWAPGTDLSGGGGGTWGSITGTLSSQTDLQTALDSKAATSHTHPATGISDSTTVGRSVMTAATAAAARSAIGATDLAIGTTGTTAMAGNTTLADLGGTPTVVLTQSAYDAIAPGVPGVLYVVTG